ncbi:DNA-directed RNA polymerase III subunit RPC9-like [Ornithodoros turicata]|uniref:DNA-directed RNA polymerase III subunit RPC9-like n=1 Tax=Ornithodoros turicata TaxID=34597 RepID=UPI0031391C2E
MKVIKENAALLSNYEVLKLLKEFQSDKKGSKSSKSLQNLATVSYETVAYLENTPCAQQTDECVESFLKEILATSFQLTKAEKLQLINHRPTTFVEIQLLIEESEERLSEDDMQTILDIVQRTLPGGQDDLVEEEEENGEDVEMEETE